MAREAPRQLVHMVETPGKSMDEAFAAKNGYPRRYIFDAVTNVPFKSASLITTANIPMQIPVHEGTTYAYAVGSTDVSYITDDGHQGIIAANGNSVLRVLSGGRVPEIALPEGTSLLVIQEQVEQTPIVVDDINRLTIIPPADVSHRSAGFTSITMPPIILGGEAITFNMGGVIDVQATPEDKKFSVLGAHGHPRPEVFLVQGDAPVVFESDILEQDGNTGTHSDQREIHIVQPRSLVVIPRDVFHAVYNPEGKPFILVPCTTQFDTTNPDFVTWQGFSPSEQAVAMYQQQ